MPEAEKFNALGAGNGFPFCLPKVDVSGYDYWTSLSGWSKVDTPVDDAAKEQSIKDSLANAMKLFWNVDGYSSGKCISTFDFGDGEKTAEVSFPVGSADATSGSLGEPKDRACIENPASNSYQVEDESSDDVVARVRCGAPEIVRMYNGDVLDEENFVGYGVKPNKALYMEAGELADWSVELMSYVSIWEPTEQDHAYTEINQMHFVCEIWGYKASGIVMDAANRSLYADETNIITEIEITSLDFWTYPA